MTYIEIQRPSNRHTLARFSIWSNYWYRFTDGFQVPLDVNYGWCARCEDFVEVERLYTEDEIQQRLDDLEATRSDWPTYDGQAIERAETLGQDLTSVRTRLIEYEAWRSALAWRRKRKSPPRCLKCGSFFAVTVLPDHKVIPHPGGKGDIVLAGDGTLGGGPCTSIPVYFDGEGLRLSQIPDDANADR